MQQDMICECLLGIFTRKISWCHEYSILCCDNTKGLIYSMIYYTFISSIHVDIN